MSTVHGRERSGTFRLVATRAVAESVAELRVLAIGAKILT
jgi:hypothetical protein